MGGGVSSFCVGGDHARGRVAVHSHDDGQLVVEEGGARRGRVRDEEGAVNVVRARARRRVPRDRVVVPVLTVVGEGRDGLGRARAELPAAVLAGEGLHEVAVARAHHLDVDVRAVGGVAVDLHPVHDGEARRELGDLGVGRVEGEAHHAGDLALAGEGEVEAVASRRRGGERADEQGDGAHGSPLVSQSVLFFGSACMRDGAGGARRGE